MRPLLFAGLLACSDATLYQSGMEDLSADRVGLSGQLCTDDARHADFPIRVVLLVDAAAGPLFSSFDTELARIIELQSALSMLSGNPVFEFAIVRFDSGAEQLAPSEGWFTSSPGELQAAISDLALAEGCIGGICRDYDGALETARSIIEADMVAHTAGERARTQYVVALIGAGPPDPLDEDWDTTTDALSQDAWDLKDDVEQGGALALKLHTLFLAAPDDSLDDPDDTLDQTEEMMERIALAGGGSAERFDLAQAFTLEHLGLLQMTTSLQVKSLVVTNISAHPASGELRPDSDSDGLDDVTEKALGTDPVDDDTDDDDISDPIEALVSMDPLSPDALPNLCTGLDPTADSDVDRLSDCEEALIGTDASLPDTDGDGISDFIEVSMGTNYLVDDVLDDADWDGLTNGEELLAHTDPRSSDSSALLAEGYRYEVIDEGRIRLPAVDQPAAILGVSIVELGPDSSGGLGELSYTASEPPTLSWRDPADDGPGPVAVVTAAGAYELSSASAITGEERWLRIEVEPGGLPPQSTNELLLIEESERQCLSMTVRNIQLVETLDGGVNDLFVYLAQAPEDRPTLPGLFRAIHIPITYDSELGRVPSDPILEILNSDLTTIGD